MLAAWLGASSLAHADARTEFLMRMLSNSAQFRVRAQAALALGSQKPDAQIVRALGSALGDEHPAVRAASAAALERLNDPSAVPALRRAQRDSDAAVRSAVRSALATLDRPAPTEPTPVPGSRGEPLYYVGVGLPGSQVGLGRAALSELRSFLVAKVAELEGVQLAPEQEDRRAAERVIRERKLVGFFLDGSVTSIEVRPDGAVRAQVSLIVASYPARDIRAMLSGAATVSGGGTGDAAKQQAIQAAFQGALRRLPQAMQAGLARAP